MVNNKNALKKIKNSAESKACEAYRVAYIILEYLQRSPNALTMYFFFFVLLKYSDC